MPQSRRAFVADLTLLAGASLLPSCRKQQRSSPGPVNLNLHQWETIEAVSERLIPGATAAHVAGFIDGQLGDYNLLVFRLEVVEGITWLDEQSRSTAGVPFAQLTAQQQDPVLRMFQESETGRSDFSPAHCFQVIHTLALEGFLSDPRHGGNLHRVGFEAIGYDPDRGRFG